MKKKKVNCLSCRQEVEVKIIDYTDHGCGHYAMCPVCNRLAYAKSKRAVDAEKEVGDENSER